MNLAKILNLNVEETVIVLVGTPEVTNLVTSDDEPYYAIKLKTPLTVRCSIDPDVLPFEADEVYVRKSAITSDGWKFIDEKKPEEGFYMPNWVVDFSKGQQIPVYQETSIKKWSKNNRGDRRERNREEINARIREKIASKGK